MIITISGLPGSGKTTVGRLVAKKLGLKFYSIGDLRGRMAMERGLTIDQLNEIGVKEEWTDREVDEYQKTLARKEDNFVIESRLGFHFIPDSIKIFLKVNLRTAAERIFKDQRPDEEKKANVEEILESMKKRIESDGKRYRKYYGIDNFMDGSHYDHVIDTTHLEINQVVEKIVNIAEKIRS
ncbi:MAG: AAA family ATPase [Candidatus Aenigmarchaeota archaeon]|nr:AAA family ATPase [Pseudomonadota bacterium]NIO23233.1 AAA family ATPase [Candidatus Aenigmarchaeota archaeon]NIQ18110.1 AAA family ATPase [Candidatus Aenigmarchaeota archaeon]